MPRLRISARLGLLIVITTLCLQPGTPIRAAEQLNVVLILADDLGAHDLGVTGSRFHQTPNLDRLANQGVRFTQAYSACTVCSPTRAALMTGKSPARLHITDWIPGHDAPKAKLRPPADWTRQLPLAEVTLAELAHKRGYTTLHIGKWHLGGDGLGPLEQGFDQNLGGDHRGQPPSYFSPYGLPKLSDGPTGEYLIDREGNEAAQYIQAHQNQPYFLNVATYGVHTPLQAPAERVAQYRKAQGSHGQTNAIYAAMLERLDAAVGRILDALETSGQAQRTVVIFTSDNGGLILGPNVPTSNEPLRSGKGSPYEGGVRVPLLIRWPGVSQPGLTRPDPVITMDVAATVVEALQGPLPDGRFQDGVSLVPALSNPTNPLPHGPLFWHYPHYHPGGATPYAAIRDGRWKLIQYYETGRHELFDLTADPSETTDLATTQPDRVMDLSRKLFAWQGSVGAQWPMYNPGHQPAAIPQNADGSVTLAASTAAIHGSNLRYEPMPFKNTLGWWSRAEDWPEWTLNISKPGWFEIEILQGCGRDSGGSEVAIETSGSTVPLLVEETGHFQNFVPRRVGRVQLASGVQSLALKPRRKQGGAIMDVRQIRLLPANGPSNHPEGLGIQAAKRIVIVGDSITYGGAWIEYLETWFRARHPGTTPEFINMGLPSETVSGLSENGHAGGAFPRPDLHERLARILELTRPDLLLACYGMNDGIYFPLGEDRFRKFRDGIRWLRETAAHEGIRVVHLTPPVFDSVPLKGKTLPDGQTEYPSPFEGYDGVLDHYARWLLSQRTNGWEVIDLHHPMRTALDSGRQTNPAFTLAGDGVHPGPQGHWIMTREVIRHLAPNDPWLDTGDPMDLFQSDRPAAKLLDLVQKRQRALKDAWLTRVGHKRPGMANGPGFDDAQRAAQTLDEQIRALPVDAVLPR